MPNSTAGTTEIMSFLASQISCRTYVNIMDQYRPCGDAYSDTLINRRISSNEYEDAINRARQAGLETLDSP